MGFERNVLAGSLFSATSNQQLPASGEQRVTGGKQPGFTN
jgi:hypothetical protein